MSKKKNDTTSIPDFDKLLLTATDIEPRLKSLWIEIYKNAMHDREQANMFLTSMMSALHLQQLNASAESHSLHGQQVVRYMERMNKANDQLLKLAEQVKAYRDVQGAIDTDTLLDNIQANI